MIKTHASYRYRRDNDRYGTAEAELLLHTFVFHVILDVDKSTTNARVYNLTIRVAIATYVVIIISRQPEVVF